VPTIQFSSGMLDWWARRKSAFAHPTNSLHVISVHDVC
jgi:hypothetical protein